MTNAIEQTKREMYQAFSIISGVPYNGSGARYFSVPEYVLDNFEGHLEAHLEALRQEKQRASIEQDDLSIRLANMTTERDELRNKHQALQMASQTAAEVIRGLRSELLEARECNATAEASSDLENAPEEVSDLHDQLISVRAFLKSVMAQKSSDDQRYANERQKLIEILHAVVKK